MKKIFSLLICLLFVAPLLAEDAVKQAAPKTLAKAKKQTVKKSKKVDLKTAYKREYAFLDAQKRELKNRLNAFKVKSRQDENKLLAKISRLEQGSVDRSEQVDQLSTELNETEQQNSVGLERDEMLQMTYSQAESTLTQFNIETDTQVKYSLGDDAEKVVYLFDKALQLVKGLSEVNIQEGRFFLTSGKEVDGKIVQLGNIAAYGISSEGSGALIPAGNNNLKLWRKPTADIADALLTNQQPQQLKIFLFESRDKAIEETPQKTWISVVESGGVIGWLIVVLGALALVLIFLRIYLLKTNSSDTQHLTAQITEQLNLNHMEEAKKLCRSGSCAISRVLESTLRHIKDDRDHMDDIISEAILQESSTLNRFGTSILVIASVSPLLGLLGTVTGMISTFDIITEFGTGDPKLLSGGISIALVTTELGLIVAIPTLLFGSLLSAWSENIKIDMEVAALRITNTLLGSVETGESADVVSDDVLLVAQPA